MVLFLFGNVILSTNSISLFAEKDWDFQLVSFVYIIFGYIYLSIPLVLIALWPFISIYTFCVDLWREGSAPNTSV